MHVGFGRREMSGEVLFGGVRPKRRGYYSLQGIKKHHKETSVGQHIVHVIPHVDRRLIGGAS
jgi:hypothetical protein